MVFVGLRGSRLGFVTPCDGEISLGPLGNITRSFMCLMSLVMGSCITERVKIHASNEIKLGMEIPTIESRPSNISMTKGTTTF